MLRCLARLLRMLPRAWRDDTPRASIRTCRAVARYASAFTRRPYVALRTRAAPCRCAAAAPIRHRLLAFDAAYLLFYYASMALLRR